MKLILSSVLLRANETLQATLAFASLFVLGSVPSAPELGGWVSKAQLDIGLMASNLSL